MAARDGLKAGADQERHGGCRRTHRSRLAATSEEKQEIPMPGQVYTGTVAKLPREVRFNDKYERTGLVLDAAMVNFVWLHAEAFSEVRKEDGSVPCHQHAFDMMIYIIEGELRFKTGDVEHFLKAGD